MSVPQSLSVRCRSAAAIVAALLAGGIASVALAAGESDRAYCERQQGSARAVCLRDLDRNASAATPAPGSAADKPAATAAAGAGDSDRAYCERQQGSARAVCLRDLDKPRAAASRSTGADKAAVTTAATPSAAKPAADAGAAPYRVRDGYFVDATTLKGFQTWRAGACDRCHGANQEGMVGPSLIASLKTLSKADFVKTVTEGRLAKGMPSFSTNKTVTDNIDALYAYLKGRSDGAITQAHVKPM